MDKKAYLLYMGLGFELAGLVVVCLFIGRWADQYFHLNGLGIAAGAFLGVGIWVVHLVMVMQANERKEAQEQQNSGSSSSSASSPGPKSTSPPKSDRSP